MFYTIVKDKEGKQILGCENSYIDRDCKTIKTVHKRFFDYRILHVSDSAVKCEIYSVPSDKFYDDKQHKLVDNFLFDKRKLLERK